MRPLVFQLADLDTPAPLVGELACLDAGDGVVELLAQRTDVAAIDGHDLVHIAQLAHRRDDCCGTGAKALSGWKELSITNNSTVKIVGDTTHHKS